MVVFHYGGAVLVNFRLQDDEELYLNLVKKHCLESLDHTEESRKDGMLCVPVEIFVIIVLVASREGS